jgi:pilus assembly protein CpaC
MILSPRRRAPALAVLSSCLLSFSQTAPPRELTILVGKGELLQFGSDIQRVAASEPKVADVVVVSPREVMINAKGAGRGSVVIWETGSLPARYEINVISDNADFDTALKSFQASLPDSGIQITGNSETLVLTGTVKDQLQYKQAEAFASTRARKVINLLQVPPPPEPRQVLLQVRFASIDRAGLSDLGFNYFSRDNKMLGAGSTQQFAGPRFSQLQFENQQFQNTSINFSDLLNLFVFRPDLNLGATIKALQQRNLLQILAEPNLIVIEGKEAYFQAGGEFPFPTIQATTTGGATAPVVTVQFKRFGIELGFTPQITANGAIQLKVAPSVTSLDFSNAVTLQGFLIPAISARRAETEVILKDGESFAIAGLIDNRVIQTLSRIRGLGDIPVLGHLFRSRSTRKSTDELLVVVTPKFVKPVPAGEEIKLPEMMDTFLPSVAEEKAAKSKKGKKEKAVAGEGKEQKK